MFNKESMSPDEWQFIRAYCAAVNKHYDTIQSIRGLMNPDWLAVKCPTAATRMAHELCNMQKKYCKKIERLGRTITISKKPPVIEPSADKIAEVFTISFFKIIDPHTKKVFLTDKGVPTHDGWSSGHPSDWQHTVVSLQQIYEQSVEDKTSPNSLLLQALLKIFALMPYKKPSKWQEESSQEYESPDWEEDEDDDDDDDPISFFM